MVRRASISGPILCLHEFFRSPIFQFMVTADPMVGQKHELAVKKDLGTRR